MEKNVKDDIKIYNVTDILPEIPCVYLLQNKINNKIYIGKANSLKNRMKQHLNHARCKTNFNTPIKNSIIKYGWDNFSVTILKEVPIDMLIDWETFYIEKFNATNKDIGYNILKQGFDRTGILHNDITKEKISNSCKIHASRGKDHYTNKIGSSNITKAHERNRGKTRPDWVREKISIGNKGKDMSQLKKPVKQLCKETGELIKIWDSIIDAIRGLGLKETSRGIGMVCNKSPNMIGNIQTSAYGYKWEFV